MFSFFIHRHQQSKYQILYIKDVSTKPLVDDCTILDVDEGFDEYALIRDSFYQDL